MVIARVCLLLIVFLFPLLGGTSGVVPLAVFALLAAGGWIGWAIAKPQSSLAAFPLRWPLLGFGLITVLTAFTSVYRPASVLGVWQIIILIAVAWLAGAVPLDRRQLTIGIAAFALAVLCGMLNGWSSWLEWLIGKGQVDWRIQSTWENANFYAAFLIISLPLLVMLARHAVDRRARWVLSATVLLGLAALVMTQSRGGLLAFFLAMLFFIPVWLWTEGVLSTRTIGLASIGFMLLIGLALVSPVGKRVLDPQLRAAQLHSQMFRLYTWQDALRMAQAHPWLGTGPGTFASAYGRYQTAGYTRHGHSIYLQAAAEMGWPGMLVLVWLLAALATLGVRALRRGRAEDNKLISGLATAQLAGLLGLTLHGLVDADWLYIGIQLTLLLPAVLVWRLVEPEVAARPVPDWVRALAPATISLVALLLLPGVQAQQLVTTAQQTDDATARPTLYRQALNLAPTNTAYLRAASGQLPYAEAHAALLRAQALEPTNAANWLFFGHLELRAGDKHAARAAYRTAVEKQPKFLSALYGMALTSWQLDDAASSREALGAIIATIGTAFDQYHPVDVPEPWYTLAWYADAELARRTGDARIAIAAYRHAIAAAALYEKGYSNEAEAVALITGTQAERLRIRVVAILAHERLAALLHDRSPSEANLHRAAASAMLREITKLAGREVSIPATLRDTPFP